MSAQSRKAHGPSSAAAAQARAAAQAQLRARERRTMAFTVVGVVVVVAVFAGLVAFIANQEQPSPFDSEEIVLPAGTTDDGAIPVTTTGTVGEDAPEDALRVDIYMDYLCGACARFEAAVAEDLDELREAGTIEVYYHPVAILDGPGAHSTMTANAAATVADQAPEHFLAFSHELYASQPQDVSQLWTPASLEAAALRAGVPEDVAASFTEGTFVPWVAAATVQAKNDGMAGTPTVAIDGVMQDTAALGWNEPGRLKSFLEEQAAQ